MAVKGGGRQRQQAVVMSAAQAHLLLGLGLLDQVGVGAAGGDERLQVPAQRSNQYVSQTVSVKRSADNFGGCVGNVPQPG